MVRRTPRAMRVLGAMAALLAPPAWSESWSQPVDIDAGALTDNLRDLERQTGIEILYDRALVDGLRTAPVVGELTTEAALRELLAGTDLTARRAASGAWIVERPDAPPLAQQDAAVAEILVVGRRTQNADIRRFESDVQPYRVVTQENLVRAHRDNLDDYFASRVTANTSTIPSNASQEADVASSIDLRGLGNLDTVVLVDGRRMPLLPGTGAGFRQSDLNAIPLHAIERVEILTGAAGGIHGFGALGGVVNVVLDRDAEGLDVHTTQGISSRGDARRHGVELRFGQRFNGGATDFMIYAAHQEADTLRAGDRAFGSRDRNRTFANAPAYYPSVFYHGNSVTVRSVFRIDPETQELIERPDLVFKPEYGGHPLGSNITYLPVGFSGDPSALPAALQEHAGEMDFSLDGDLARSDLGPNPRTDAVLANFRHAFESGWEAYVDAVLLRSRGETYGSTTTQGMGRTSGVAIIDPASPANPFTDLIEVYYPIVPMHSADRKRIDSRRYTAGVETPLPFGWRGTVEASWGGLEYMTSIAGSQPLSGATFYLFGDASDLDNNPLGHWDSFDQLIKSNLIRTRFDLYFDSRFRAQSLRLAGPVFETRAGPATLSLLAERRSDRIPRGKEVFFFEVDSVPSTEIFRGDPRSRDTRSFHGELRVPLFDAAARLPIARELELQFAARHDRQEDTFPSDLLMPGSEILTSGFSGTAFTVGARITPTNWLMVRASYATGEQPPPSASLVEVTPVSYGPDFPLGADPKRGGNPLGSEGEFLLEREGNAKLRMARASTFFAGAVFTPRGEEGPRFALDYSRIHRSRDLANYNLFEILEHEDAWPSRVRRAPLTDEDRANGYTGGRVEMVDTRVSNDGALHVDAFDLRAEWPLRLFGGRLRLHADATYQKRNVRTSRFQPDVPVAGYRNGPLQRRANGGFDWTRNDVTLGANLQYFGSSLIFNWDVNLADEEDMVLLQGSRRIPSQTYLDLHGSWRVPVGALGGIEEFTVDFGIVNVLDRDPPREHTDFTLGPGYSRYGDPRMRRFELVLSAGF